MPISAKFHKWTIQDLHQEWKEIRTGWGQNSESSTSKQDPLHSKHSNNVYVPLTYTLQISKVAKTNPAKQRIYKQTIKTFWWTMGEPNYYHGPTNQRRCGKVLEATIWEQKIVQKKIGTAAGIQNLCQQHHRRDI